MVFKVDLSLSSIIAAASQVVYKFTLRAWEAENHKAFRPSFPSKRKEQNGHRIQGGHQTVDGKPFNSLCLLLLRVFLNRKYSTLRFCRVAHYF